MIARVNFPEHVSNLSKSVKASLETANNFVRYIQALNTKTLCSCVQGIDNYLTSGLEPNKTALLLLMDKATAQQWQLDMIKISLKLKSKFGLLPSMTPLALGSYLLIVRTARDIRSSVATRKLRILQAILGQIKRARANTKDISAMLNILLSKGFYL